MIVRQWKYTPLEDEGEVYEYFDVGVGDKIIKDKKYKGAFEEAILLEVDIDSYFKERNSMEKVLVKYGPRFLLRNYEWTIYFYQRRVRITKWSKGILL